MSHLIAWKSVCLVCLQKGENRCIFGEDNDSIVIADKIMTYSDILIKRDTNQPKSICLQCLDDLNVAHKFCRNYEQSESIIKGFLNTNHQGFRIKDSWKTSPTTGNPILDICIKEEVVDNTTVDDCCENTSCHVNRHLNREELNESSEHTQKKSLEKEIFQIQENTNSNEIIIKHEIVDDDLIDDNCDIRSTSCIDVDNSPVSEPTNGGITKQSTRISLKICEICNRGFRRKYALDVHMRRHKNERPFSCDHCGRAYVTRGDLRSHVRIHTPVKPYKCHYCDLRFCSNEVKKNHESKHTGVKPYKCPTCDKSFGYSKGLKLHLLSHNKFTCKECGKEFIRKNAFQKHVSRHLNQDELNKPSEHTQKKSLEKEIFQVQENTNWNEIIIKHEIVKDDLIGDNCDNGSTPCIDVDNGPVSEATNGEIVQQSKEEIPTHPRVRLKQSMGISLKICKICNHGFRKQYSLDVHMRRHNNERPFSCDHCDKAFVTGAELRIHMRVHTGEKPYKCQYCDLRFSEMCVRQSHESKHTGEKPFKCPTCDRGFGYSKGLKLHLLSHNKFSCKECGKEFTGKVPFERHVAQHLAKGELDKSSEHEQKKRLEKEIDQIGE